MDLNQRMDQRLEQRLKLEQRLEARLYKQQINLDMALEQYLEQEDIIKGFIRWANEHNSWVNFNKSGFKFVYAALPYKIAGPIADKVGIGFAHCFYEPFEALFCGEKIAYAKGDWTLFVVKDMIPKELVDFVAIHERGEEISLGNHYFASQLEFALVSKRGKLKKYVDHIDENYPSKFIDLTQEVMFPVLPKELIEYLENEGKRNKKELERAEELIDEYPLPSRVLRLMDKYDNTTEKICKIIRKEIGTVQNELSTLSKVGTAYVPPEEIADLVNNYLSQTLRNIDTTQARVVSRARTNEELRMFSEIIGREAFKASGRHLIILKDFELIYRDAINNRRLVTVRYTPLDRAKQKSNREIKGYNLAVDQ